MENDSLPEDCDIAVVGVGVGQNQSECICSQPTTTDIVMPVSCSSSSLSLLQSSSPLDTNTVPLHHPDRHHPPSLGNNLFSIRPTPPQADSTSFRADPAHIKEAAGDDLCLRCALSCVFCELISMCSTLEACLACPFGGTTCCCEAICCCCSGEAEGVACGEEACQALVECCSSSDFMDFGLECCSFFFSS